METTNVTLGKGLDGNSYTKSVSNDQLTNKDFLKLMIEELKRQDPTKPMNSKEMINSHMQMSAINTNQETIKAMKSMKEAFLNTSLANVTNLIGKNIENGDIGEKGINRAFKVNSIENIDGEIKVKVNEILYMKYRIRNDDKLIDYNQNGEIYDANGKTEYKVLLESPGNPKLKDGKLQILDKNNELIKEHKYSIYGSPAPVYSKEPKEIPLSKITKVF